MYKQALEELKDIDLSITDHKYIKNLISEFGKFGLMAMDLHPGKEIIRGRPNDVGQTKPFCTRQELSYKPQEHNHTYQRASTPNRTMFYGGILPEEIKGNDLDNARLIATMEASKLLREPNLEGEQVITCSKWVVTQDIRLLAICYHRDFLNKSAHTQELYDTYQENIKNMKQDEIEKAVSITEFLAREFAKKEIKGDFDYMISAIFTEMAVNNRMDGIYYPSVRADAKGFNVAISPDAVDSSLKLVAAGECTIYKHRRQTIIDNETACLIDDDTKPFMLKPVARQYHAGRKKILKELGVH